MQQVSGISQSTRIWQIPQSADILLEAEYRSLEFFQIHTTFCFGSGIGTFLLQAVYHEPVLRTIAVALGSLHRSFVHGQNGNSATLEETRFTLLYYNKAIRQLVSIRPQTTPQANGTFLIACIFFFCFECLQGHYKSAFQHAISGLKIIKQEQLLSNVSGISAYIPFEKVTLLFSILENQIVEIEGEESLASELRPTTSLPFLQSTADYLPRLTQLTKIDEIFVSFQFLYNHFTRFGAICELLEEPPDIQSFEVLARIQYINVEYSRLRTDMETWVSIFDNWLEHPSSRGNDSDPVMILKVWKLIIGIFLRLPMPISETTWDQFTDDFSAVNSLVADLVGAPPTNMLSRQSSLNTPIQEVNRSETTVKEYSLPALRPNPSGSKTSIFALSLGIVTPLYLCATRCRDSSVRYHSIRLLSHCQRREGLWDSDLAARIAKRMVTIEESAARIPPGSDYTPPDIASVYRVRTLSTRFEEERHIKIRYNEEGANPSLKEEVFAW